MAILNQSSAHLPKQGMRILSGGAAMPRRRERGIVLATSQDRLLAWSYTTTLSSKFDHPEIFVAGLDPFLANAVLTHLVDFISRGKIYREGRWTSSALQGRTCVFHRMSSFAAPILMPPLDTQPALQLIYPDHKDRLPWQLGHCPGTPKDQPLFSAGEIMGELECRYIEAANQRSLLAG